MPAVFRSTVPCITLIALASGCGGGGAPLRASAPRISDDTALCRAAALHETPLVTEWSSAEKASLQARLRAGALAVEYTGCSMRPILSCNLRGSYRWQRTTLSSETIAIQSKDELFTKLPLGAFALEGELARAGSLQVRTMVGGQYVLDGSSAADVPDYGDCAQATHLLSGLSIGSFKLNSGGSLQAGASVGAFDLGAGTKTASSETMLREAGDFESCHKSTDETPDLGCSSPIQAFLVPLPRFAKERGSGTLRVTFASGDAERPWELRSNQQFVCRTPCTRWVNPAESYQLRTESGPALETVNVPDLRTYGGSSGLEVRAHPRANGAFLGGIVATGLGGGFAFIGGFLALAGAAADRSGLVTAGAVTAGVGLVAVAPGVWLIASSGSHAEVLSDGSPAVATPRRLGIHATF
ncbi:MAG TPA: hypothetical protein VER04_09270 [Polyangiaceae bacterium]|nr:hypothetical protein [Polyangiaceae bacterium]